MSIKSVCMSGIVGLGLLINSASAGLSTDALGVAALKNRVVILFSDQTSLHCDKEFARHACDVLNEKNIKYRIQNDEDTTYIVVVD